MQGVKKIDEALYLEPGELGVIAAVARRAAEVMAAPHPQALFLRALADALDGLLQGDRPPGRVVAPASPEFAQAAALALVRSAASANVVGGSSA